MLSETIAYMTIFALTIIFSCFAFVMKDSFWRVMLKVMAALFWFIMAVCGFTFFGSSGTMFVLSLPYAVFGMLFIFAILKDFLDEKKERIWKFED